MYGHQLESYSETIYDEANLIASSYSSVYQGKNNGQTKKQNMDTAYLQLQAVADFAGAEIWIVNRQGIVVTDSSRSARAGTEIPDLIQRQQETASILSVIIMDCFPMM